MLLCTHNGFPWHSLSICLVIEYNLSGPPEGYPVTMSALFLVGKFFAFMSVFNLYRYSLFVFTRGTLLATSQGIINNDLSFATWK
jgi:hypothetical protein